MERLASVATTMPDWDAATRTAFVRGERAIVDAQVRGWRREAPWAAWRKPFAGQLVQYGENLAAGRFDLIEQLGAALYPN